MLRCCFKSYLTKHSQKIKIGSIVSDVGKLLQCTMFLKVQFLA